MRYGPVIPAVFLSRLNRFSAVVSLNGAKELVHVKNTGRCRELLLPGARVWLAPAAREGRKTAYDLVTVEKKEPDGGARLVNLDSQVVNDVAEEWLRRGDLFPDGTGIRREVFHGSSRFDFCLTRGEQISFLEVKGVTLARDGAALFPDAPTLRGVKHLNELIACRQAGMGAYVLFVIAMKGVTVFRPNDQTHPAFGQALRQARAHGVQVLALDCLVTPDGIVPDAPVAVDLS